MKKNKMICRVIEYCFKFKFFANARTWYSASHLDVVRLYFILLDGRATLFAWTIVGFQSKSSMDNLPTVNELVAGSTSATRTFWRRTWRPVAFRRMNWNLLCRTEWPGEQSARWPLKGLSWIGSVKSWRNDGGASWEFHPPPVTSGATSVAGSAVQESDFLPTGGLTHVDEIRRVDVSVHI